MLTASFNAFTFALSFFYVPPLNPSSPQVDIHPLRIHLTESLYRMLFDYVFPKDDLHPLRRADYQTAALPPSGSAATSRRNRRPTVEAPNPSLSRQSSGDSLKSPHSPKPGGTGFNASPGGPTGSWAGANPLSSSPVDMDPELMAEVSRVSHTRQPSSSGYSSGEPLRGPAHRRTASAIEFGSTDSALLEAVVAQPTSAGRSGSYSGPLAMTAQTSMSLGQVGGLLQVQAAAILAAAGAEGSGSSETPPVGKKRRKQRAKAARQNEEEVSKSKDLVIHFIKIAQVRRIASIKTFGIFIASRNPESWLHPSLCISSAIFKEAFALDSFHFCTGNYSLCVRCQLPAALSASRTTQ